MRFSVVLFIRPACCLHRTSKAPPSTRDATKLVFLIENNADGLLDEPLHFKFLLVPGSLQDNFPHSPRKNCCQIMEKLEQRGCLRFGFGFLPAPEPKPEFVPVFVPVFVPEPEFASVSGSTIVHGFHSNSSSGSRSVSVTVSTHCPGCLRQP
jgi:hypothetical protein